MFKTRGLCSLVLFGAIGLNSLFASGSETLSDGWAALSQMNVSEAVNHFTENTSSSRRARLGAALALFNSQPHTEAKKQEATGQLTRLKTENTDDATGIAATFYLARIRQIVDASGATEDVITSYRALLRDHPGNPIAEMAAPKLAILLLYAEVTEEIWTRHVAEIEALIPHLQSTNSQRDTRLILAQALLKLRSDHARALPLIEYCLQHDLVVRPPRRSSLLLQAAESARILQQPKLAVGYYRLFISEFPYDSKTDEVRRRLAKQEQEARS